MIPMQIRRVFLVAVAVVTAFWVTRDFLIPPSFGQYGHYRGNSVAEVAALPVQYAGEEACYVCHAGVDEIKILSGHAPVRCEGCHGPSERHALNPAENPPPRLGDSTVMCLLCHEANPTRPPDFSQVDPREHRPGIECIGCHDPHIPERNEP